MRFVHLLKSDIVNNESTRIKFNHEDAATAQTKRSQNGSASYTKTGEDFSSCQQLKIALPFMKEFSNS